jgi:hypothetical protein
MGAVGLIFPLALAGVPLSVPKWLVLETSTIESVVAVFIDNNDEDEDEGEDWNFLGYQEEKRAVLSLLQIKKTKKIKNYFKCILCR